MSLYHVPPSAGHGFASSVCSKRTGSKGKRGKDREVSEYTQAAQMEGGTPLADRVQQQQPVQVVLHPSTQIHKIQQNADELFAWVDVSFTLYQSLADQTGKRDEHTVLDPKTQKPLIQHMQVLLLAGLNTVTGQSWLVMIYALNAPPPEILDVP